PSHGNPRRAGSRAPPIREPTGWHCSWNDMKIAAAQLNPTIGDISGNSDLVSSAAKRARAAGADLLVVSELFISGYPPKDLLLREGFVAACDRAVMKLAETLDPSLGVLVGHPSRRDLPE